MNSKIAVVVAIAGLMVASSATAQFRALPEAAPTSGPVLDIAPQCGTPHVNRHSSALVEELLGQVTAPVFVDGEVRVPVAMHLITSGRQGKFSRQVVDLLIHNLNVAFSGTGFSFHLVKLDYTNNRKWYEGCGPQTSNEAAMKKKLAYFPDKVLNIYSCKPAGRGIPANVIGYAYFPWMLAENNKLQGVVVHPGTLPSGSGIPNYDYYGLNAVHEVGHWLGLLHTFHEGCAVGDQVDDTPAQVGPTFTCDLSRDSCPQTGRDDVQNFMNYVDDHCYDHFTPGQAARMRAATVQFRPSLF